MIQQLVVRWKLAGDAATTECAVLALDEGYRVIVTVNGESLADEIHATPASALTRAEDLKGFLLAQGFSELPSQACGAAAPRSQSAISMAILTAQ